MAITFDPAKDAMNKRKHGISLAEAERIDLPSASFRPDTSQRYGEVRYQILGFIGAALHSLICTFDKDENIRAISLRKATKQEEKLYAEEH